MRTLRMNHDCRAATAIVAVSLALISTVALCKTTYYEGKVLKCKNTEGNTITVGVPAQKTDCWVLVTFTSKQASDAGNFSNAEEEIRTISAGRNVELTFQVPHSRNNYSFIVQLFSGSDSNIRSPQNLLDSVGCYRTVDD